MSEKKCKVSIIVPSYNSAHFLPQAIESALNQTFQDFEILIIDDGSTDATKNVAQGFMDNCPEKVRYVYQENKGLACARNTAIEHAQGEYLALLDADDVWMPERLEVTVNAMEQNNKIGLVHANIQRIDTQGNTIDVPARDLKYLKGQMFSNIYLRKADVSCPTVLFRKECCDQVGLFDEHLARLGCEDRELWLRIAKRFEIVYIDQVLAYYRVSDESMSRNKAKMMEARRYVIDKHYVKGCNDRLRNNALARIYRDLGDEMLGQRKFIEARKNYAQAISFAPVSFWPWVNLMKTVFRG